MGPGRLRQRRRNPLHGLRYAHLSRSPTAPRKVAVSLSFASVATALELHRRRYAHRPCLGLRPGFSRLLASRSHWRFHGLCMLLPPPRLRRRRFAECLSARISFYRGPKRACREPHLGQAGSIAHAHFGPTRGPHPFFLRLLDRHGGGWRVHLLLRARPAGIRGAVASPQMVSARRRVPATGGLLPPGQRLFPAALACHGAVDRFAAALAIVDSVVLVRWPVPTVERLAAPRASAIRAARVGRSGDRRLRHGDGLCGFVFPHAAQNRRAARYLPRLQKRLAAALRRLIRNRHRAIQYSKPAAQPPEPHDFRLLPGHGFGLGYSVFKCPPELSGPDAGGPWDTLSVPLLASTTPASLARAPSPWSAAAEPGPAARSAD